MGAQGKPANTGPGWRDDGVERGVAAHSVKSGTPRVGSVPVASASFCEPQGWEACTLWRMRCLAGCLLRSFVGSEVKGKV